MGILKEPERKSIGLQSCPKLFSYDKLPKMVQKVFWMQVSLDHEQ